MPERIPTGKPTVIGATTYESGVPNTGQFQHTLGGTHTYSKLSGVVGPDVNVWVGGGRLDTAFLIPSADPALSGKAILFYDSAISVSGGPLATSGHKVIGGVTLPLAPNASSGVANYGGVIPQGFVFTSGLCHTTASGQVGFVISFTPVVSG